MTDATASRPDVSVILPVCNEASVLEEVCEAVCQFVIKHTSYEFVFVNDGSIDETQAVLNKCMEQCRAKRVRTVGYEKNRGKGFAIRHGFQESKGQAIVLMDGDLPYSLELIPPLVARLVDADVVIGSRPANNPRGLLRRVLGNAFNRIVQIVFHMGYADTQAGIKAFRYEAAETLFSMQRRNRFAWDVEILVLSHQMGLRVTEHPVFVEPQHAHKPSSIHPLVDSIQMLFDVVMIRFDLFRGKYHDSIVTQRARCSSREDH